MMLFISPVALSGAMRKPNRSGKTHGATATPLRPQPPSLSLLSTSRRRRRRRCCYRHLRCHDCHETHHHHNCHHQCKHNHCHHHCKHNHRHQSESQNVTFFKTRPSRPTMRRLWMNVFLWTYVFFMKECQLWMNEWFNEWITRCMLLLLG